ncbi:carbon storage regulator CsrA [Pontiellaceae bacterium B12219]|nr:carbon storage regulator CsrA [Pontiellaceae bacterium B12219]
MLILTRKSNESVMLREDIEVKVLSVRGDQVSLGFSAPAEMNIYRKEIFEAILAANKEAAEQSNVSLDALCGMFGQ